MKEAVIQSLQNLRANKLRSVLTVLGVIIAVTSTLVVVAVVQGFSSYVSNFLQGLGTNTMWVIPEVPPMWDATVTKAEMLQGDIDEVEQSCSAVKPRAASSNCWVCHVSWPAKRSKRSINAPLEISTGAPK